MKQLSACFVALVASVFLFAAPLRAEVMISSDLELTNIFFSTEEFIAGDRIRIYASVENHGEEDVVAYVNFKRGSVAIGNSQLVSVRAGGLADEVFVDFTIPNEEFNIQARVLPESIPDLNSTNDEKLTTIFKPLTDSDGDRVPDIRDDCPTVANADQNNNDEEGEGDACDLDDDNDTVPDEKEVILGTDPLVADTDEDGVSDAKDVFPLDSSRSSVPPGPVLPKTVSNSTEEGATTSDLNEEPPVAVEVEILETEKKQEQTLEEESLSKGSLETVPRATLRDQAEESAETNEKLGREFGSFWNFENPIMGWLLGGLILIAVIFLTLDRKYKKTVLKNKKSGLKDKK